MAKRLLFLSILAGLPLASALIFSSCSATSAKEPQPASSADSVSVVPVQKVVRRNISQNQELMAEFRPMQEVDVHAKVAGYLKQIFVDVGDHVAKGQTLAILEVPELSADLDRAEAGSRRAAGEIKQAEAQLQQAEAAHEEAHITYTRLASLPKIKPNLIAQEEIDQAKARDAESEARVTTAKVAITVAQDRLSETQAEKERVKTLVEYSKITAPFSGIVTKRYADTGAMIPAGTNSSTNTLAVIRLSEDDMLRLVLPVPEALVPRVQVGSGVQVQVQALKQTIVGKVWRFTGNVDTSTRTMDTEVEVDNSKGLLKPGMYASARLTLDQAPNAIVVPVQAIVTKDGTPTVFKVKPDHTLEECKITIGLQTPWDVQVNSGLTENDLVVVGNSSSLKPGEKVVPKTVETATTS